MNDPRETALIILNKACNFREPLKRTVEEKVRLAGLNERDRAFCRDLVNGTVQRLNTIDWIMDKFSSIDRKKMDLSVKNILRLGIYQIIFLGERIPLFAAVNESVKLVKKYGRRGASAFVNGVLRGTVRGRGEIIYPDRQKDPADYITLKYSYPGWLSRRWVERLGSEGACKVCEFNSTQPDISVRINALRGTRKSFEAELKELKIGYRTSPLSEYALIIEGHPSLMKLGLFRQGRFIVQDVSSQLAGYVLDPKPGEYVMDICSGVGGKTTHLAELMENKGRLEAVDTNKSRMSVLKTNCRRLGIDIADIYCRDISEHCANRKGVAEKVIVDAPCSGMGVVRRHPDIKWSKSPEDIKRRLPEMQKNILSKASLCVKPGGVLVYSVCSFEEEENEGVAGEFLKSHKDFRIDALPDTVRERIKQAVTDEGYIKLYPGQYDTDGFFIARFRKES